MHQPGICSVLLCLLTISAASVAGDEGENPVSAMDLILLDQQPALKSVEVAAAPSLVAIDVGDVAPAVVEEQPQVALADEGPGEQKKEAGKKDERRRRRGGRDGQSRRGRPEGSEARPEGNQRPDGDARRPGGRGGRPGPGAPFGGFAKMAENLGKLPDDVKISITKSGSQPGEIAISQGDSNWTVKENELEKLPPEARRTLGRYLAFGVLSRLRAGGPGMAPPSFARRPGMPGPQFGTRGPQRGPGHDRDSTSDRRGGDRRERSASRGERGERRGRDHRGGPAFASRQGHRSCGVMAARRGPGPQGPRGFAAIGHRGPHRHHGFIAFHAAPGLHRSEAMASSCGERRSRHHGRHAGMIERRGPGGGEFARHRSHRGGDRPQGDRQWRGGDHRRQFAEGRDRNCGSHRGGFAHHHRGHEGRRHHGHHHWRGGDDRQRFAMGEHRHPGHHHRHAGHRHHHRGHRPWGQQFVGGRSGTQAGFASASSRGGRFGGGRPQAAPNRGDSASASVEELRAQIQKLQEQQEQFSKALQQIGQALDKISRN